MLELSKYFKDVFPGVKLNETMRSYFENAVVDDIMIHYKEKTLLVDLILNQIVFPGTIRELSRIIQESLDVDKQFMVKVNEKFHLQHEMPLSSLYPFYLGALVEQVNQINPICGVKLARTEYTITGNQIKYLVNEQISDFFKKFDIVRLIEKVYKDKFRQDIEFVIEKTEAVELVDKFIARQEIEQKGIIQEMAIESNSKKSLPVKVIEKSKNNQKKTDNLLVGKRNIAGQVAYIQNFNEETDIVIIEVCLINYQERETKSGKHLLIFDATDYTNTITCKCFLTAEQYEEKIEGNLKAGMFARVQGRLQFDNYQDENIIMVTALEPIEDFRSKRQDDAKVKRVEFHLHTQMSDMDSVIAPKLAIQQAIKWGHKAIAITDHGVVQAFPEAFHAAERQDIKVIYGVEAYIVDDDKPTIRNPKGQGFSDTYVVFDIETTGLYAGFDKITEIGAVKIFERKIVERFSTFVNPERAIPLKIQQLTSITQDMVKDAPIIGDVLGEFLDFAGDAVLVAHNADFDLGFIKYEARQLGIENKYTSVDTVELSRTLFPNLKNHKLNTVAEAFSVKLEGHHRAVNDAEATAQIFVHLMSHLDSINIHSLEQYIEFEHANLKNTKRLRSSHAIILAQNQTGIFNLYKLISMSHLDYYYKHPRIPKSVFKEYREGLLLGSACEAGEVYRAILEHRDREELDRIASFYDYFEIQPLANNEFLIRNEVVTSKQELMEINRQIIELGKSYNKLVVATCDAHFLNPEDEVFRRILLAGKGFGDADEKMPLYLRTTDEMLAEFYYLGDSLAYEVVVENTNKLNDSIEKVLPINPKKFPPKIEGSDKELRDICYQKAYSIYGNPLPEIVKERIDRELNSIITNGFAVMYIIAQKLVWKSNEEGYLVGSRGSVGSSFAATMAGITEVNPLAPHYLCENCKYVDFDSPEVKQHSGNSGCDLPDKNCPQCGEKLIKDGHDIPFETFLGFKGDKEPDIDLNFSGEYQSKAHEYTEVLFGKGHVYRAGTIGTLAEKTAFGFVKKYFDERKIPINKAEINRLVSGCTGVRRSSGQHPGGIIVVPKENNINEFTPVQHPANDMETSIITTHFDYHSIDQNLLKLDILGHDDPTIIKMLEDLTGVNAQTISLDEPKVMSLFAGTDALGIQPDDIGGCRLGCLGVPEFGTDFVIQMLIETKPKCFSDLVRISGLSHGTNVWQNNAQELVKEGKANISTVISTRDDIMAYLIGMGVENLLAFTIMESVRKGKKLKPEWEVEMRKNNVPDWYIWSCNKIEYMFPKAHAVAYVMMAYRIAYFKVYYPIQYYTAFFSIRAANIDYELMCKGSKLLERNMNDILIRIEKESKQKGEQAEGLVTKKEKDMLKDMRIVQEMYARKIDFTPIDLYRVDAKSFQIFDNKIMPSLSAIQGLGEKAAENMLEARKKGSFLSIEDLRNRTKITKTVLEVMKQNGILDGMSDTNQLSLF